MKAPAERGPARGAAARSAVSLAAGPAWAAARAATVALLAVAPWVLDDYALVLLGEMLVYALFAMSLDLVIGYAGLISLGHAAFFGVGGYAVALLTTRAAWPVPLAAAAAVLGAGVAALAFGAVALRARGPYFIMLTFALAELLHTIAFKADWAGGSNGLVGVPRPGVAAGDTEYYFVILIVVAAAAWLMGRLVRASVGRVLVGIRENPGRMAAMGYAVDRFRLAALAAGGLGAGLAGALEAPFSGYVGPNSLDWIASGEVMIMVVFGGVGTLRGPAVGAALFILLREVISSYTEHWMLVLGVVLVGVVLVAPDGLAGLVRRAVARVRGIA